MPYNYRALPILMRATQPKAKQLGVLFSEIMNFITVGKSEILMCTITKLNYLSDLILYIEYIYFLQF